MGWASTTPVVIPKLVELFRLADGLSAQMVLDGPVAMDSGLREALSVGYSGDLDAVAVEGDLTDAGMSITPDRERYTVQCAVWVLNGAGDMSAARARAYEILAAAGSALAANHTLDGLVLMARVSTVSLAQSQTSQGAVASIVFGVSVDAFTVI